MSHEIKIMTNPTVDRGSPILKQKIKLQEEFSTKPEPIQNEQGSPKKTRERNSPHHFLLQADLYWLKGGQKGWAFDQQSLSGVGVPSCGSRLQLPTNVCHGRWW